ncbi:hypothetical protein FOTG_08348 [Fusarium oxysporum f. sp. vasinfectum 25433]|uniref:Mid2 domain-containing protein n=1 Tax=Fusarium oxysporum f. sp. vasinfectum 25433 TaxID=1089449 RepID=X0LG13_FUSOX|nr:hypothetical protein FOTG_08348 [Fusarium oxysporum f. sp. vasinfectum 25433]
MLAISLALVLSIIANRVLCSTKFLRPPEWNSHIDDKTGFEENIRYEVGDTIQLLWETDLDKVDLHLAQRIGPITEFKTLDASRTEWKAEWDVVGSVEGNEDSLYWFVLVDPDDLAVDLTRSQSFNSTTSQIVGLPPTRLIPIPTVTDQSSNEEANSDAGSDSGMSKGELAGAAVGGTIGGLILLGAVGWLIWRRLGRSKKDTDVSVVTQSQQQQFHSSETKAELPGDPAVEVYPSGAPIETWATYATATARTSRSFSESDEPKVDLYVWQMNPTNKKGGQHALLERDILLYSTSWKAEYDMGRYLRHGGDSVYWFGIYESGNQQTPLAESQYFNVTAPDPPQLHTATVSETVTSVQESATLQLPPQSTTESGSDATATEVPSGQETKANTGLSSRFELTTTEIVGIAVGASLGGVLILGGIGWLGCRKSARRGTRNRPAAHYQQPYQWGIKERERALYLSAPARRIGGLLEAP